jgi:hypothetical protein
MGQPPKVDWELRYREQKWQENKWQPTGDAYRFFYEPASAAYQPKYCVLWCRYRKPFG